MVCRREALSDLLRGLHAPDISTRPRCNRPPGLRISRARPATYRHGGALLQNPAWQAHKRCSIKLRIAADEVMCTRHEFFSVYVSPWLHIVVPAVHDNGARVPVLLFARHEVSAFEKQNFLTRWREPVG